MNAPWRRGAGRPGSLSVAKGLRRGCPTCATPKLGPNPGRSHAAQAATVGTFAAAAPVGYSKRRVAEQDSV